jgi:hypothetical protein
MRLKFNEIKPTVKELESIFIGKYISHESINMENKKIMTIILWAALIIAEEPISLSRLVSYYR